MNAPPVAIRLLVCTLFAGCGGVETPAPDPVPAPAPPIATPPPRVDLVPVCRGIDNTYQCGRAVERYQMRRAPRWGSRDGKTLTIHLAGGRRKTFVDSDSIDVFGVWYTYREFLPQVRYHLVHAHLNEGTGYFLVSHASGDLVPIQALPIISPDGRRFATASEDLESHYNPNEVQIWRITNNAVVLEWSLEPAVEPVTPDAWGPANLRWISATEIRVRKVTYDPETFQKLIGDEVAIRRVRGRWTISPTGTSDFSN